MEIALERLSTQEDIQFEEDIDPALAALIRAGAVSYEQDPMNIVMTRLGATTFPLTKLQISELNYYKRRQRPKRKFVIPETQKDYLQIQLEQEKKQQKLEETTQKEFNNIMKSLMVILQDLSACDNKRLFDNPYEDTTMDLANAMVEHIPSYKLFLERPARFPSPNNFIHKLEQGELRDGSGKLYEKGIDGVTRFLEDLDKALKLCETL